MNQKDVKECQQQDIVNSCLNRIKKKKISNSLERPKGKQFLKTQSRTKDKAKVFLVRIKDSLKKIA